MANVDDKRSSSSGNYRAKSLGKLISLKPFVLVPLDNTSTNRPTKPLSPRDIAGHDRHEK